LQLRPTSESDATAISRFLHRILAQPAPDEDRAAAHMGWKYWCPRADWTGSRGFTVQHRGAIVAHGAAWPVRLRAPGHDVPAVHVIDWAADSSYPGAGIWLMRQIVAKVPLAIATGGSEMTRRILPLIGFRPHGELAWFARPVRPVAQALTASDRNWKFPARVARNAWWRWSTPLRAPSGWSASPLDPRHVPDWLWPRPSDTTVVGARDGDFYRYVTNAPSTPHRLFGLKTRGKLVGYFCVAFGRHVARIADLWLPSAAADDWGAAFQTAAVVAARPTSVHEVTAWASTRLGRDALAHAGFRQRDSTLLSVRGDMSVLAGRTLHVQMLDSDASFLSSGTSSYLT